MLPHLVLFLRSVVSTHITSFGSTNLLSMSEREVHVSAAKKTSKGKRSNWHTTSPFHKLIFYLPELFTDPVALNSDSDHLVLQSG